MDNKLTLKLDGAIIEKAKNYARSRKTSLSVLVENYLQKLTRDEKPSRKITPLVKSLSGIIDPPKGFDERKAYQSYLTNKYK